MAEPGRAGDWYVWRLRTNGPMLAAFYRSNQPVVLFSLPVLAAALFAPAFWGVAPQAEGVMPLAGLVQRVLGGAPWLSAAAGLLLVVVAQLQLVALINDLELMDRRNHLVAFFLPVALAGFGPQGLYDPALLGLPFVLWSLRRAWGIANTGAALQPLFDAGLLAGLAALCYLPYAVVVVVIWASVSVIRPFAWREYVLPLLGCALLFYLAWGILRLSGSEPWLPLRTVMAVDAHPALLWRGAAQRVYTLLFVLVLLIALAAFNASFARSVMRGKNLRSAFMALALAMVMLMALLQLLKGSFPAVLAALPAAVLVSYAFLQPRRGWLAESGALALLALALWLRWT